MKVFSSSKASAHTEPLRDELTIHEQISLGNIGDSSCSQCRYNSLLILFHFRSSISALTSLRITRSAPRERFRPRIYHRGALSVLMRLFDVDPRPSPGLHRHVHCAIPKMAVTAPGGAPCASAASLSVQHAHTGEQHPIKAVVSRRPSWDVPPQLHRLDQDGSSQETLVPAGSPGLHPRSASL